MKNSDRRRYGDPVVPKSATKADLVAALVEMELRLVHLESRLAQVERAQRHAKGK